MTGSERDAMRATAREVLRELLELRQTAAADTGHKTGHSDSNGHGDGDGDGIGNGSGNGNGHADDHDAVIPMVPAPPVAAVLRPSTWSSPAGPGEVIGEPTSGPTVGPSPRGPRTAPSEVTGRDAGPPPRSAQPSSDQRVESVTIANDDDLERFVRALVARVESPRDRLAIRSGRLRFVLRTPGATQPVAADRADTAAGTSPGGHPSEVRVAKGPVTERVVREAAGRGGRLLVARGAVVTPLARDCARAMGVEIEKERTC